MYGRNLDQWQLQLRLPKMSGVAGFVRLSCGQGAGFQRAFDLSQLNEKPRRFDVDPTDQPIGIVDYAASVSGAIRERFNPTAVQIPKDRCVVFHSTGLSQLRGVGAQLYWNTDYYILWDQSLELDIPGTLHPKDLAPQNGWHCTQLSLPDRPSELLRSWFQRWTDFQVESRKATLSLIAPVLQMTPRPSQLSCEADKTLVLTARKTSKERLSGYLTIEAIDGTTILPLEGRANFSFSLSRTVENEFFFVRYNNEPGIVIETSKSFEELVAPSVYVRARLEHSAPPSNYHELINGDFVLFQSIACHRLLIAARAGTVRLEMFSFGLFSCSLKYRAEVSPWTEAFIQGGYEARVSRVDTSELERLLLNRALELEIKFSEDGRQRLPSAKPKPLSRLNAPTMLEFFASSQSTSRSDIVRDRYALSRPVPLHCNFDRTWAHRRYTRKQA